ncbi:MAG TPA: LysM peptidoglycan-binding domain-containing protein, partial [Acetobacteraceae bacterium]|nr:LysM peptidoglycan-binding domain-containing protein [Acetobacteraceae bacterium]
MSSKNGGKSGSARDLGVAMVAVFTGLGLGVERGSGFVLGSRGQLGSAGFGRFGENVYVNAATGNLAIQRSDEVLLGVGADANVGRSYNSLGAMSDDNGDNWRLNASRSVAGLTGTLGTVGSTVTRTDWDGSDTVYSWDASRNAYVCQQGSGAYDTLSFAGGIWTWTDGSSQRIETYDDAQGGRILNSVDTDGNALSFSYTGSLLTRVTTADGEHVDMSYAGNNLTQLVTTLQDGSTLSRVRYGYDVQNRLSSVTTDLTPADNSVADGQVVTTTYSYDGTSDRVASISQTGGARLDISYVLVGSDYRVASLTQAQASGASSTTSFSYDVANRITTVTDAQGQVSKLTYDAQGQLVRLEQPAPVSGGTALVSTFSYTATGDVASVTDGNGNQTSYSYDANGNLTLSRDAAGNTVAYSYDAANHLLTETHYLVPDPDGAGAGQPGQPLTTRYAYDAHGHLRYVVSAAGRVTRYDYTASGQVASNVDYATNLYDTSGLGATDPLALATLDSWTAGIADKSGFHVTDTSYDFRGNVSTVTSYSQTSTAGVGLTSAAYSRVTYVYDQAGHLLSRHDNRTGAGSETFLYDGLGRLIGSTDLAGATTSIVFADASNSQVVTAANGVTTTSVYDLAGELISTSLSGTGVAAMTTSYAYDSLGQLRMTTNALGQKSYFLYDHDGREVATIAADGALTETVYDAGGRVAHTVQYATKLTAAQLASLVDANGKPTSVDLASVRPSANAADRWNWDVYDQANRLIETIDSAGGATVYGYDGASQLVSTTRYANAIAAATLAGFKTTPAVTLQLPVADTAHDRVTRSFYDQDGLLVGTLDATGALTQFVYDAAGEKIRTVGYANFTSADLRATGSFAQLLASVGTSATDNRIDSVYDDEGQLRFTLDANARPTEFVYDASGNLIHSIDYAGSIAPAASYALASVQAQVASLAGDPANRTTRFVYDAAGRLAYVIDAAGTVTATSYDVVGHVVKQTVSATSYTAVGDPDLASMQAWASASAGAADHVSRVLYDGVGRPVYAVDAEGYVTESQYDALGEVVKTIRYADRYTVDDTTTTAQLQTLIGTLPASAVVTSYAYDTAGRVTDMTDATSGVTHYGYDALGQLTDTTLAYGSADAVTTHTAYDSAGRVLSVTQGYGTAVAATTSYTYDALGHVLTVTDARSNVTTNGYDALGRVVSVTDPLSGVTSYQYDAFGNRVKTTDVRSNTSYAYYDALDRLVLQVDAAGYATATSYSVGDAVLSVTHYATKVSGSYGVGTPPALTASATKDEVTSFIRDKLDRVTRVTDAEGYYEQYTLDAFGNRGTVRNKLGGITTNVFDRRGLLVSETKPETSTRSDGSIEASSVTTSYAYDARGNRIQMIEAAGLAEQRTTSYAYDKLDRMVSKTGDAFAILNSDKTSTSLATPVETFRYDARGNLIEHDDAAGARTLSYYDALDRKIASVNALGTLSAWTYDGNGNVLTTRVYGDAVALPATPGGTPPAPVNSANYRETRYAYDKDNRQIETRVVSIDVGEHSNGTYVNGTQDIVTATAYDAAGNIISQTDPRGHAVYSFYDKAGHKIAEVDQENYLTSWDRDGDGNVVTETRYATRLSVVVGTASDPAALKVNAGSSADDRITQFSYDRNGRRLTETRLNLVASSVSATGALTTVTTNATVSYNYNGLGQVTRKTEANGDTTDYSFDFFGRMTEIARSGYVDSNGASVRPTTDMQYDGLDELTRQLVRGTDATTEADDRITSYAYDKAGHVITMTDPTNFVTSSYYDIAGHLVKQQWVRLKSDGSGETDADFYSYDLLGHQTMQQLGIFNGGTSWTLSETTDMRYDAYGEMVARGISTGGNPANYQEFADYDAMGRVWRTNFNDGVTKAYVYDANGNATLLLQSTGSADLRTLTLAQMVAAGSGVTETQSVFDKRNQLIETIQPSIANAAQLPGSINAFDTVNAGSNFTGGAVSVGSTRGATGSSGSVSGTPGALAADRGTVTFTLQWAAPHGSGSYTPNFSYVGNIGYGGGAFHLWISGPQNYNKEVVPGQRSLDGLVNGTYTLTLYQDGPAGTGQVFITQGSIVVSATSGSASIPVSPPANLQFQGQNPNTSKVMLFVRPQGSSGPYQRVATTQLLNSAGAAVAGWFTADPNAAPFNGLPANSGWDVKYYAMDANGNTLNAQTATLSVDGSGNPSFSNIVAQPIGGAGKSILTREFNGDWLISSEQAPGTQSVLMYYRVAGSNSAWSTTWMSNNGYGQHNLWATSVTNWGGPYEYWLEDFSGTNGTGSLIGKNYGTFSVGGQPSALTSYADQPETVHIYNQPPATSMLLWYKPSGTSNWIQAANPTWNGATGSWDWDANGITPDKLNDYAYDFRYETYNGSVLVNQAHGQVQLGYDPAVFSNVIDQLPATVVFSPPQANATTLILNYRAAGSTGAYSTITLSRDASGKFSVNADAARPASGSITYEYFYDLRDSAGNPVAPVGGEDHATGYLTISADRSTDTRTLQWVLVGSLDPAATIDRQQAYNAFGDIVSETDGLNRVTTMAYNVIGKLILKQAPLVSVTDEHGVQSQVRPTERYYYDLAGRLVGVDDANGNRNTLALLAGSGEEAGENAITTKEFHADGGVRSYGIDVFGDVRTVTDELNFVTTNSYDKMDRLVQVAHPTRVGGNSNGVALTDFYAYDGLGHRIKHWNSQLGSTVVETTDYGGKGRVIQTRDFAGNVTSYSYSWSTTLTNSGTGTVGGLIKSETDASGHTSVEQDDYFSRVVTKTDLGGHSFNYGYDKAGNLIQQTNTAGQSIAYAYYGNGYIRSITDNSLHVQSTFEYDKEGNRTLESYIGLGTNPIYYQVAAISYDELNRIKTFTDAKATISYEYDANSNRRRVLSYYHDGINGDAQTQDYWYKYDGMNRFVLTMGTLSGGVGGTIQTGTTGVQIGYDAAGQRKFAINGSDGSREDYSYTADGYLEDTKINGVLRARRVNDAVGRVTTYSEYLTDGVTTNFSQASTYDGDNRVTDQIVTQRQSDGSYTYTNVHNDYRADAGGGVYTGADQGVITHSRQQQQGSSVVQDTVYGYQWWDEAKQASIQVKGTDPNNPNNYQWAPGASQLSYDVNGHLKSAVISGGTAAVVTYTNDAYGQVLEREQTSGSTIGPRQLYYYFDGNRIGDVGNDGPSQVDYAAALAQRGTVVAPGAFRGGKPVASADFDENYQPIGPSYPGMAATAYTVRSGDTLASIAQAVWGDSSLWYLIADANGLTASDTLVAGQQISIPNKVANIHNRTGVYRVYNPGEAIGDLLPTLPAEPAPPVHNHGGCGVFGQILLVAVAVAVSAVTYGALGGEALQGVAAIEAGAAAGAAGSVASQALGVATGIQDHFSFKGVALAAIAGGIGSGLGKVGILKNATDFDKVLQNVARGAISNGLTQGVALATGLQNQFDWTGVAAGGIASGVAGAFPGVGGHGVDHYLAEGLSGSAAAVAASAARSLLSGSDFGDNILRELPDAIGATIGNAAAHTAVAEFASRSGPTAYNTYNGPQDARVISDIVVVGRLQNWADRLLRGLDAVADWAADHNIVTALADPISRQLDNAGLHSSANLVHAAGTFVASGERAIYHDAVGIGRAIVHPVQTELAIAGALDTAIQSNASDVLNGARQSYNNFASANIDTQAGMLGGAAGHVAFATLSGPVAEASLGRIASLVGDARIASIPLDTRGLAADSAAVRVGPYGDLTAELKGTGIQANHLNQDAAFRDLIPRNDGLAVGMRGNAFTEVGSAHYEFHSSLEEFWSPYR